MTIEEKLKELILSRYKSIRAFTQSINIPYTTIDTMFKRGIGGTSVTTIIKICYALDIDIDALSYNEIIEKSKPLNTKISYQEQNILNKYQILDEKGQHTVNTVLNIEYDRCKQENIISEQIKGEIDRNHIDITCLPQNIQDEIVKACKEVNATKEQSIVKETQLIS